MFLFIPCILNITIIGIGIGMINKHTNTDVALMNFFIAAIGLLKLARNLKTYTYAFLVCIFYPIVKMMDALDLMDREVDKEWSISILSKTTSFPQYFGKILTLAYFNWRRDLRNVFLTPYLFQLGLYLY